MLEQKYPIRYERYALIPDSGGAGRHRGGLGAEFAVRMRAELNFNTRIERMHCRPWGLAGGAPGHGNRVTVIRDGNAETDFPNAKIFNTRLKTGDGFVVHPGGGGGFGPPWQRPADRVAEDVRQGYVTIEGARSDYGVALDPETLEVDKRATAVLRAALERGDRSV